MKILHVITGLQKAAGTTTFVENVVREQRALNHTVEVLTNENVHHSSLLTPTSNFDVVHIHGLWSMLLHKAAQYARHRNIPVVWSTHGMTAPWSLHHKWWKKCLPWYLYQLPDLRSAALIHCTTDLEADWNKALGFTNTFVAPLGTNLPTGRGACPYAPAIDATTNDALARDFDRRAMAEKKVAEWLVGVDDETFDAALEKLVGEKVAAGEYRFEREDDIGKALAAAKNFFAGYSRRIVKLSDGRCVYFAPDPRSRSRNGDNAISWAEYAFHAVSSGGDKIPGKTYNFRKYNEYKVINTDLIESTLKSERCVPVLRAKPFQDAIKFFGAAHLGGLFDVVVRLDEYGNVNANMTEVTFEASTKRGQKKLPQLVSLTEAIRTVVSHQTATGTYPPDTNNIANPSSPRKGGDNNSALPLQLPTPTKSANSSLHLHSTPTPKQQRTLLYVGRIYPVKALDNAIRAVALMKQPITLRLVGPDQSGHMAELMSLCDSLHLPYTKPGEDNSSVHLHLSPSPLVQFIGPKYDADLSAEYDACDAIILVSHTENFGATVVDALAHSKPVITSTNTPWSIVQGKSANSTVQPSTSNLQPDSCGWWVDNSPESLARTFDAFASTSTSNLNLLGQRGLALVQAEYTWPAIARNLVAHYEMISKG